MRSSVVAALLATLTLVGCGSNSSNSTPPAQSGSVFVTGEDAPSASVVGFDVTINTITLTGHHNSPQVLAVPTAVDFARLIGLCSPLAFSSVPADTYSSATFVLTNPVISYVDMTQNPPALNTINGTLPQSTYSMTVNFPTPMVVGSNGLAGLKVTDLTGGLASVDQTNSPFVMQGPYGRQLTVYVNDSTQFNSGWSMSDLAVPAIVGVEGAFQADGSLNGHQC